MFARETFDYPELEEHPLLCNHLGRAPAIIQSHESNIYNVNLLSAPKLKGRPRKRRKLKEVSGSPNSPEGSEHESNSSEGSNCSGVQKVLSKTFSKASFNPFDPLQQPPTAKSRKDLLAILSQKNTKEETEFLKKLIKYDI